MKLISLPGIETKSVEIAGDHVFTEVKFAAGAEEGKFSGYGAMFGNLDSHGDIITPGAFSESLAERKAQGRGIPMHLMHKFFGGDGLPVGVWTNVEEDDKGLKVEGKISGMNTDAGRRIYELVKDGALGGLSIGYKVRPNGASYGKNPGEAKRTLKKLDLREISLVDDPSNPLTRVSEIKSIVEAEVKAALSQPDTEKALNSLASAMRLHDKSMGSEYSYASPKDKAVLMDHLMTAHHALSGARVPDGLDGWMKSAVPATEREFEEGLREKLGFSNKQAKVIASLGFKALASRDESEAKATEDAKAALTDLATYFRKS